MIATMQTLKHNPHRASDLYLKYTGEDASRDGNVPEGIIDAKRIEKICIYNHDALYLASKRSPDDDDPIGLWLLPSYMNHSCLGGCF